MWYIERKTINHMVPLTHTMSRDNTVGVTVQAGCELAASSDGVTWDDTSETIIWETDTLQTYHMVDDGNGTLINDPNFTLKSVPADRE